MARLDEGTLLANRYTLIRKLGGGGEADLWLARDRLTATSVALKIISADERSVERLRDEWQSTIRLLHAHIVRAFEFHADAEIAFYSQQFVDGPDIGVLAGSSATEILAPIGLIADALRYVHAKGRVHRDIKAANILLDRNGAPYLADFGVACAACEITSGGSLIAQSPQSLAGMPAQPSDDVFALGGLIYELVSGNSPYTSIDIARDIRERIPAPLSTADGTELPVALIDLVARMLDKDPLNRPTAAGVAAELDAAGFVPGAATIRGRSSVAAKDEIVEARRSIRPRRSVGSESSADTLPRHGGVARMTAVTALLLLLVTLIGVVVVLPDRVADDVAVSSVPIEATSESEIEVPSVDNAVVADREVRDIARAQRNLPTRTLEGDDEITFSENEADYSGLDAHGRARFNAEAALGEMLSAFEILEGRGVERWAPLEYRQAHDSYAEGDQHYLKKDFADAENVYLQAISSLQPLYERIQPTFEKAYAEAQLAFEAGDRLESLRLYELAVAITPTHPGALAGFERAKNLEAVLRLVEQGLEYEQDLDLVAAQRSFDQAVSLDRLWQPAHAGVRRVTETRTKMGFDARMSEGFDAIARQDYLAARAAFRVAKQLIPKSDEPSDGLLQVDQGLRLQQIGLLEREVVSLQTDEHWDAVVTTYEEILKVDNSLSFASDGLRHAREMSALHSRLDALIAEPDRLSVPSSMQKATQLVVEITVRPDIGMRLSSQRDELSRLLKRAATPLTVALLSDNVTEVSIYKVGRLGNFMRREVTLRPGTYVAVGIRPGYRDVREEFRVAPEVEIEPVVVRCEEQI